MGIMMFLGGVLILYCIFAVFKVTYNTIFKAAYNMGYLKGCKDETERLKVAIENAIEEANKLIEEKKNSNAEI